MMPGIKRKLRLMSDWTVDLLFGRDTSELGQLGHPPLLDGQSAGGTKAEDAAGGAALSTAAVALVLVSAGLHAFWNWLIADARDSHAVTAVALRDRRRRVRTGGGAHLGRRRRRVAVHRRSAALELIYFALLATAYQRADLSFVYPIARGAAPVMVLVVSVAVLGASLSTGEAAGVLAVTAGVLLVRGVGSGAARDGLLIALAVAACIAGYTLVDDEGIRHAASLGYFEAVLLIIAPVYATAVAVARGPARCAPPPRRAPQPPVWRCSAPTRSRSPRSSSPRPRRWRRCARPAWSWQRPPPRSRRASGSRHAGLRARSRSSPASPRSPSPKPGSTDSRGASTPWPFARADRPRTRWTTT